MTFAYFIAPQHRLPGAPWYLAAVMLAVSLLIAWSVAKDRGRGQATVGSGLATAEAEDIPVSFAKRLIPPRP